MSHTNHRSQWRAFRPESFDHLESREVLSSLPIVIQGTHALVAPTLPMTSAYQNYHQAGAPIAAHNTNVQRTFSAPVVTPSRGGINVNLPNGGRFVLSPMTGFGQGSVVSPTMTAGQAATNGLAFTGGLGFTTPPAATGLNNFINNGLAFTNGLGSTTLGASNTTNNGLAFTNGLGAAIPGASNTAANGLAFTNGLGSTIRGGTNNATNGLAFTNGLGSVVPGATNTLGFSNGVGTSNFTSSSTSTLLNNGVGSGMTGVSIGTTTGTGTSNLGFGI